MEKPHLKVISQGCAANFGEGEKIARLLSSKYNVSFGLFQKDKKFETTNEPVDAYVLNVCTVKGNASALKLLRQAREQSPKAAIYITGCAPKDLKQAVAGIDKSVVFTTLKELSLNKPAERSSLREAPLVGIVNIEEGCLDACSYCSTRLVKGLLRSFPAETIVDQVQQFVSEGCREIQLTGQDCGCYGFDFSNAGADSISTPSRSPHNLAELVQKILVEVPGDYRIRLGMGNPRHILKYREQLLECFQDDRVYKFIHLPVQSGSERILQAMNRRHTAKDYVNLANEFNSRFSLFTLSTDLIVGFPGESDQDFKDSLKILEETRPTVCNITRFVSRPGTQASRLANAVPVEVKHQRSAELAAAFQQIAAENNARWIGINETVTIEKEGYRKGTFIARNDAYRPVAIAETGSAEIAPGTRLQVQITGAEPFALIGEPRTI